MTSQTTEQALEACIEKALVGTCKEERREGTVGEEEQGPIYGPHAGYEAGLAADFDREFAIDRAKFWRFLEETQAEELAKLSDRPNWQRLVLERLNRKIQKDGILSVLKKGLAIDDAHLTLLYSLPYNDTNPDLRANFYKNIFSVTRQVHYSDRSPNLSIDMVVFLNGLAIATLELKNPWSGQTVYHAKKQYREDRDPKEPLLQFARCIVHFAVIIDEAHSSQSGRAADKLHMTLGMDDEGDREEPEDVQDIILKHMAGRKLGKNASYFAFTATPKNATLEKFGRQTADGQFVPFHLYSMKQAIEEGFILDVLTNYTTYRSYYEIQKSIQDNPLFDTAKAQKKLRAYVEGHKETIAVKADIMVSHFIDHVWKSKKLKGKAKAMVVTRNIENAIRYFFAIREALTTANVPSLAIIAFSGKKTVDGVEYTEDSLNNFPGKDIPKEFKKDKYKILVVANKFLTGFDESLLHTMYVDKKLQSVLAVQTVSRLNRCNEKMGKNDTFVLDFFNSAADIKTAFDPFYTATSLSEATDVNVLHDVKEALDDVGVYEWHEVEAFNALFFNNAEADQLSPLIDTAAARFTHELELEDAAKIDFKIKAKQFVRIYGQVACIISYNNIQWEMLYWFLKFLIPKLQVKDSNQDQLDKLLDSVDLSTYGLERVKVNQKIDLDAAESTLEPQNPNPRGYHGEDEKDLLDEIIKTFNERFFAGWDATPEEQRVKFINIARHVVDNPDYAAQVVNNQDEQNRQIALEKMIQQAIGAERKREFDLYKRYANDPEFKRAFNASIGRFLQSVALSQYFEDSGEGREGGQQGTV